jgi:asparagine N-glycosylation enzyme membrane subunit Stt3
MSAMPIVWSGSLLYVALAEGARFVVAGLLWRHPGRLLDQAASAGISALLIAPWVALAPTPIDGAFASTALSWLHVWVLLSLCALAVVMALLERKRPEPRLAMRGLRALGIGLAVMLPGLAIPGLVSTLGTALTFVSGQDVWAAGGPEQQPLFSSTAEVLKRSATVRFGWLVYLVPLLPLIVGVGLRDRARREQTTLFLMWTTLFAALALKQVRFAHDLAPLASVVFGWLGVAARDGLARVVPRTAASAVAVALALALLWPAIAQVHLPRARFALDQLARAGGPETADASRGVTPLSPWESEARFAVEVGRVTPETAGYLDARQTPEYALLVDPSFGHSFLYWARRPVPANNFGQYLDREKFDAAALFYAETDATRALEALDRLDPRFVVTAMDPYAPPLPYSQRLHRGDGFRGSDPVCGPCLRLVSEGPPGGTRRLMQGRGGYVAYKLFERVDGALVEVAAPPGAQVKLELDLVTPLGRRPQFEIEARADDDGWARLRVPYATDPGPPVHAEGPYRVRVGDADVRSLEVPDEAVRSGAVIALGPLPAG